ncbi:low temperature requirement protein A [Rugosimonospora africana]|uniref:low temperature requirement protein A n=1 Tax=Rugosimonospora africana TaxID=556532 RepID=UPI001943FCAE|nr:low temperature requirement protein A [Rugosimonospora africana]
MEQLLRDPQKPREISFLELFFDLAIIFALTQFSQRFLRDFRWENSLQTLILLAAVWWVWVGAARTTDWLDPDKPFPQVIIVGMMFAGLVLAASVPQAFGKHGVVFAGANVAAHLVRHLSIARALRGHPVGKRSARAATWFGATAILWLAGSFLPATPRLVLWSAAVILDYLGVGLGWRVPGLPPTPQAHLRVLGTHIAERHRQIFVIAVGELVLTSGITFSRTGLDIVRMSAFALAFAIAGLVAWIFFLPRGLTLGETLDRRRPAVAVFASYTHLIMILGIVVTAMSAEILVSRPLGETRAQWSAAIVAGPFLFLGGRALYAWGVFGRPAWRAPTGMVILAAISPAMVRLPPLAVAGVVGLVLLAILFSYQHIGPEARRAGTSVERLLKKRRNPREISSYELFFDLAMIFALTRVSQRILTDFGLVNIAESLILVAGVYWIWVATAWSTDWFNPDEPRLQRLIIGIMFAELLMASAVPTAFGAHGLLFAGAYAGIHIVRGLVIVPALRGSPLQARSARVLIWFSISAVLWLVGAFLPGSDRIALWAAAIALDGASAWFGWPVPRLSHAPQAHLKVIGEHIAERYRQVYIISLGALVLLSSLAYSRAGFDYVRTLAFVLAFTNAALLLWSYFLPPGRDLGNVVNATAPRVAVAAAYCHGIMIAGTVVTAAGAEMYIRRPLGAPSAALSMTVLGGAALHILGRTLLGLTVYRVRRPWRGPVALLVIAGIAPGVVIAPPLVAPIVGVLVILGLTFNYRKTAANPPLRS